MIRIKSLLNESADSISFDGKWYRVTDPSAYPIIIINDEIFIGKRSMYHGNAFSDRDVDRIIALKPTKPPTYLRMWITPKVIAGPRWAGMSIPLFKKMIDQINKKVPKANIDPKEWYIEDYDKFMRMDDFIKNGANGGTWEKSVWLTNYEKKQIEYFGYIPPNEVPKKYKTLPTKDKRKMSLKTRYLMTKGRGD